MIDFCPFSALLRDRWLKTMMRDGAYENAYHLWNPTIFIVQLYASTSSYTVCFFPFFHPSKYKVLPDAFSEETIVRTKRQKEAWICWLNRLCVYLSRLSFDSFLFSSVAFSFLTLSVFFERESRKIPCRPSDDNGCWRWRNLVAEKAFVFS